jgi:hypothetical protein
MPTNSISNAVFCSNSESITYAAPPRSRISTVLARNEIATLRLWYRHPRIHPRARACSFALRVNGCRLAHPPKRDSLPGAVHLTNKTGAAVVLICYDRLASFHPDHIVHARLNTYPASDATAGIDMGYRDFICRCLHEAFSLTLG